MLFATAFELLVLPIFETTLLGMLAGGLAVGAMRMIETALLMLTGHARVADPRAGRVGRPAARPVLADDLEGPARRAEGVADGRAALDRIDLTLADPRPGDPRNDLASPGLPVPTIGRFGRVRGRRAI